MKFDLLRLQGFKSFVEPSELAIETGLTGVIGPNGCGKSNLVEALRWVMGETSAKSLRGGGMDDVIFAGTRSRPSRNHAEVMLRIDNHDRSAPAAFNDADTLEVSRRIDREEGSTYRVNGKEVRAKDVQLLFADAATGPNSASLVRQGQIGTLINAKPKARRGVLEEAAGITGLHARRREAELRLEAAEANLARLEDIIGQCENRVASLKRQARQAAKYRDLSKDITRTQAQYFLARWMELETAHAEGQHRLQDAQSNLMARTERAAEASTSQATSAEVMPDLRQAEVETAARLQRLVAARDLLDKEAERIEADREALGERRSDHAASIEREKQIVADALSALKSLALEGDGLAHPAGAEEELAAAKANFEAAAAALQNGEEALEASNRAEAEGTAKHASDLQRLAEAKSGLDRLQAKHAELGEALERLAAERAHEGEGRKAREQLEDMQRVGETLRGEVDALEAQQTEAQAREREAMARLSDCETSLSALKSEAETLASFLGEAARAEARPVLDDLSVKQGFEAAVAAAFGEDLQATQDTQDAHCWDPGMPYVEGPALPRGVLPLATVVTAPPALRLRLEQIGLVEPAEAGRLHRQLKPGQLLVSRAGDLWNWDGLIKRADAETLSARVLAKRNRLGDLEALLRDTQATLQTARLDRVRAQEMREQVSDQYEDRKAALAAHRETFEAERADLQAAQRAHDALSVRQEETHRQHRETEAEIDAARQTIEALDTEIAGGAERARAEQEAVARARSAVEPLREAAAAARLAFDGLQRDFDTRTDRLKAIGREIDTWSTRRSLAEGQITALTEQLAKVDERAAALAEAPAEVAAKRASLLEEMTGAEADQADAANAVAEAENRLRDADRHERDSQNALSQAKESLARLSAEVDGAKDRLSDLAAQIQTTLDCRPEALAELADYHEDQPLPAPHDLDKRLDHLKRQRDGLGAVNLRAEEEMSEADEQLRTLTSDRDDLTGAIRRLRGAISDINQEGRERILTAFETVDTHFRHLFTRLFRGGTAELKLVEDEDPLNAGLEILAKPPGKSLQSLSLLSGGEQALTAMSLIFAVFRANPAPVCVLDEVDAPLDDANVERFCALLDELARTTETRFLVITHHALTMSRMDRLYGVTMAEQGISQLVSVDLTQFADSRAAE
ncbi:MAG: AAA family ATPase [Pseudomonadota bacterium]